MLKKLLSLALAVLLIQIVCFGSAFAKSQGDNDAQLASKVKEKILERGIGSKAYVEVRLKNQTKVKGNIYKVNEDDFIVADRKTDEKTTVAFTDVEKVKGKGMSKGTKIVIGVAIGVAALVTGVIFAAKNNVP